MLMFRSIPVHYTLDSSSNLLVMRTKNVSRYYQMSWVVVREGVVCEMEKLSLTENHCLKRTEGYDKNKAINRKNNAIRNSRKYTKVYKKENKIRDYLNGFLQRKFTVTIIETL